MSILGRVTVGIGVCHIPRPYVETVSILSFELISTSVILTLGRSFEIECHPLISLSV